MAAEQQHRPAEKVPRFPSHEALEQCSGRSPYLLKGKGGVVKHKGGAKQSQELRLSLAQRLLLPTVVTLSSCLLLNQMGLFVPIVMMTRNCIMPKKPREVRPKYPSCSEEVLAKEMTIVVTVKDACSQAPGFIRSLETFAPPGVHLIYTFPNFESCAHIQLNDVLKRWKKVTKLPLPLSSSPMQGWIDAIPHIKTKYSMLLHNDGYALDSFFGCELLRGLQAHKATDVNNSYVIAAPMLYESKMDGSLAAHATQTNLRLVKDDSPQGVTVHHDHSLRRALNRGNDFKEGPQTDFVEDHGFLIETDKIGTVIDPKASFTLEYLDMIMTIRANNWKVLFVPTARLEFRITEFSWRDIPYFMYKRSEATAHGTRDYLMAKWKANFPNTGFWTYIKYTIVEQHVYREELDSLAWKDQAALAFGFFQMAGFNRYDISKGKKAQVVSFLDVLQRLDKGWSPAGQVQASRSLWRPPITQTRTSFVSHLDEILPYGKEQRAKAHIEHEYLPFAVARLTLPSCDGLGDEISGVCGLLIEEADSCVCWINMPTFKANSLLIRFLSRFAAMIKVPSRVTTFIEMVLGGSRNGTEHVLPLRSAEGDNFRLAACDLHQPDCSMGFSFTKKSKLKLFRGAPATVADVSAALEA